MSSKRSDDSLGGKVKFTNRDKVFWREKDISKGDLIEYYRSAMDYIFPFLKDRPHVLLRHPDGYAGNSFFQKDMDHAPQWAATKDIKAESTGETLQYLVCGQPDTLLYMVQLGCIEINPWNSRADKLMQPDWIVMDIDPKKAGFEGAVEVAKAARKFCKKWDIPTYPKTSGKTGMHVYIPTKRKYGYEQTVMFSELLSQKIVEELPDIVTMERKPQKRKGKVYIDYLRNSYGQTLAAPFSVRPTKEATVSMPLTWGQVRKGLKPTDFTMKNALKKLEDSGNPWKDFFDSRIDFKEALDKIEK